MADDKQAATTETAATDTTTAVDTTAAASAAKDTTTIAASGGDTAATATDTKTTAADATAAPDWRAKLAGDDKDALSRLSRFTDENAFYKSYRALEGKLSSGEFKKALPDTATPEEKATWRKENGFPEAADGYFEKMQLPNGIVLGEADKPVIAEFAAAALEANVPPSQLSPLIAKYYQMQDTQRAAQEDADAVYKQKSEDVLRNDWQGQDFRRNLNAVSNMMAKWPEGLADRILAGRTADGKKLGDDPLFIKQLASMALEINPFSTLVPAGTSDPKGSAETELESIRELRRNDPAKYAQDEKKYEAREIELLDAKLKVQKRVA